MDLDSFSASDPTARQIEMSSKLVNTKLSPNPTRVLLNQHLTYLLQYWEAIDGNSTADPDMDAEDKRHRGR